MIAAGTRNFKSKVNACSTEMPDSDTVENVSEVRVRTWPRRKKTKQNCDWKQKAEIIERM